MKYRADIDGLRAIAVLSVVIFHLNKQWLPGGFVGVDVFFVISGFLITSIILRECSAGTFTMRNFLVRRIRRILPASTAVILASLLAGLAFYDAESLQKLGAQALFSCFSAANVHMWIASQDYWVLDAESNSLLHMWSLGVEEQFYLVFPVVIMLALRIRKCGVVLAIGFILSVIASWYMLFNGKFIPFNGSIAAFYLIPSRGWELLAGGILAWYFETHPTTATISSNKNAAKAKSLIALAGLAMIVASFWIVSLEANFPLPWAVLPVLGTCMVIYTGTSQRSSLAFRFLSNPTFNFIGDF